MANDRNRYGNRASDWQDREDDGYIARRGFGNRSAGYDRNAGSGRSSNSDEGYGRGRERDFGDSAGYGTGGSALDWHDVVGDNRGSGHPLFDTDRRHDPDRFGQDRYGRDRSGSESFGRGSRDYHEDRGFMDRAGDEVRSWFGDDDAERRRDRDMREAGQHRGRGPKGYQRSDARILEDVNDRLTEDPHVDASEIDVRVENREVTLTGTANSRFEKRHAEDIAESVSGVTHVQNNLRIQQAADAGIAGTMMSGAGAAGAGSVGNPTTTPSRRRTGGTSGSGG
ncbi:BON domain-containing protein [Microvirga splendida]|uniref:BON domain-containing protein n=1 Tax=Microvirga splendida TaxID=2795727 RepID=A0ABS0XXK5_9HYPH|nr:BON domain-containing protein [Microvirga splendida]MBJ6124768.1 BON domain-containing protein [Microvirga splendida]